MSMHYGATYGFGLCLCDDEIDQFVERYAKANKDLLDENGMPDIDIAFEAISDEFGTWPFNEDNSDLKYFEGDEKDAILPFFAKHQPDVYKTAYSSVDEVVAEFRELLGKYMPENFDWKIHIGYFSIADFG